MKKPSVALLCIVFLVCSLHIKAQSISAIDTLTKVFHKIEAIQSLYYHMNYKERIYESGKIHSDSSVVKYQKSPRRLYIKSGNGSEVLWGPDINGGNALVHPTSFPFFNVNLNINGNSMRKNQHHSIDEIGFDYFENLVKASIDRAGNTVDSKFFYQGDVTFNGFHCEEVLIINPGFNYVPYTVKQGETILTIARSFSLNEYMILKHNPSVNWYTDVKPGQTILIPNDYATQVKLYIDKNTMLPVMTRVDDEKGLFEEYDYTVLKVNPGFKAEEFFKNYKDYHF